MFWRKKKRTKYACSECGELHSGWPALSFSAPGNYDVLSEEEQNSIADLDADFCIIYHEDQVDRFIRVSLSQLVLNSEEDLNYGVWVSLSEESFNDYKENFTNKNHEVQYFGWLCNNIPEYDSTNSIPTTIVTQKGNQRPVIYPHKNHGHRLVFDFYNGISSHEAQNRVNQLIEDDG